MSALLEIDAPVPFGTHLYCRLQALNWQLADLVRDRHYELPYLAWETVRKQTNPFFELGTGFEGYLVGTCHSPEQALETILGIAHHILECMARRYHFEYNFQQQLMRTLQGETENEVALAVWSTWLGVTLAQLRPQVLFNHAATRFRLETYHLVQNLPPIRYYETQHLVWQHYVIPRDHLPQRMSVNPALLAPWEQEAWTVARLIGRFGHPLLRQFLATVPAVHYVGERRVVI